MRRRETGILGEKIASQFLKRRGYCIIEANYRCPEGEIDLIARHKDYLVFVEVRTRRSLAFGTPEESITAAKKERLRNAAAYYQQTHGGLPQQCRIDVVAIELNSRGRPSRLELIENAVSDS
jgi:putative endonuclease